MDSNDLQSAMDWARKTSNQTPPVSSLMSWLPIILIIGLIGLAAWWWWANYSQRSAQSDGISGRLNDLKQGAKDTNKSNRLILRPNGTAVAE